MNRKELVTMISREHNSIYVVFQPKVPIANLTIIIKPKVKKRQTSPVEKCHCHARLRNCFLKESKESWTTNIVRDPGLDPRRERKIAAKDINETTNK